MHSDSLDRLPAPRAAEAVALPRRHVLALAVLVCIPVPLLSLGGTALPLRGLMERAVATFAPFVAPVLGTDDGRVVRRNAAAVRPLNIRLLPSETTHTRSRGASDAGSALDAPGMPRARTAKAPVTRTKPKQRPKTPRDGSTPGTAAVPLPTDDDPHTGGSSGEGSGGSGESGSGGSNDGPGSGGGPGGGGSGDGSGGNPGGGSGGGSGGSSGGSGGGSGGGSDGGSDGEPAPPATPPIPPDPGGGGGSGGGSNGSGGNGSENGNGSGGSSGEHGPPAEPPTPPDPGGESGSGGGSPPEKKEK